MSSASNARKTWVLTVKMIILIQLAGNQYGNKPKVLLLVSQY